MRVYLDGNDDGQSGANFVAVFSNNGTTIERTNGPSALAVDAVFARGLISSLRAMQGMKLHHSSSPQPSAP